MLWGRRASTESLNLNDAADRGLYTSPLGCCAGSQRRKCPERSLVSSQGDTQPAGALPWNSPAGLRHLPSNERDDPSIRLCSPESSSPGLLTRQVSSLRGPSLQMSTGLSGACQMTQQEIRGRVVEAEEKARHKEDPRVDGTVAPVFTCSLRDPWELARFCLCGVLFAVLPWLLTCSVEREVVDRWRRRWGPDFDCRSVPAWERAGACSRPLPC